MQVEHDIITVDNIHAWVEPPPGPDVFTINVESALNFSGRWDSFSRVVAKGMKKVI